MVNDQKKTIHRSSQSPENVEESWSSTPPSGPRRVVQRSTANSVTKKRSAAAPTAANDEGSDEEDEARLKRLRNLPWPPKSVPSEAGNDEKPTGDLRNLPWPPPLGDNDHHSPALRWSLLLHIMELRKQADPQHLGATTMPPKRSTRQNSVANSHAEAESQGHSHAMGETHAQGGGQTHGGENPFGGGQTHGGEQVPWWWRNPCCLREANTNKEDHQNKNDNRNHEERESHNKNDTPFVTMSDVADLLKQERERAPKEPRHFVRRPPYPIELLKEPYPEKYDTPVFALFDGRKGSAMEHISKFLDSMGPFAANGDLCLREFSKSLVDRAYTWYTVLPAGSIRTWEDMVESFCSKYFHVEEKITLVNLHSTKQQIGEDLVKYIHRFRDVSLDCHVKYQEGELVEVCIDNMLPEFRAHLENLDITRFAPLLQKARKTAISVKPQVEKSRDKKSLPQTLTVSTATAPSGTKRKNTTDKVYEEPPPLPFTAEEMMAIFDKWVQDQVIKLPKISKQPTPEEQKDPKYCRYHRYVNHSTVDCRTLRWEVNRKIQNGTLLLSEAQQKVHQTPFPNYNKDKGKAVVSVVIHGNVSDVEAEESAAASSSLVPAAVRTLQRSPKFKSLFNQLGFGPEARNAATEALITIAAESGATCFTAEAHASRAFLETTNAITFTDEDMEVQYPDHRRPLYLSAVIKNVQVRRALVDTGSCLNLIPLSTLQAVDLPHQKIQGSPMEVTGFGGMTEHTMGHVQLVLKVGPIVALTRFHVVNAETPYHVLLGRPWLHKHKLVSSTYHQCVKGRLNGKPIRIAANSCPFDQTEAHFVEAALYDDLASTEEPSIVRPCGTPLPAWEDIKDDPEIDLRELLQRKKKRKERAWGLIAHRQEGPTPEEGGLQPSCHLIQQTENSGKVVVDQLQSTTMNSEEVTVDHARSMDLPVDHSQSTVMNSEEEDAVDQTESTARRMKESTTAEPNLTSKEELEVINLSDNPDITKPISISKSLSAKERKCLIDLLHEYKDVFAWDYHEMPGIDPGLVAHSLNVEPGTRPVVQPMRTFHTEVEAQITQEVKKLLAAGFIKPIQHPRWLSNIVPVKKKNGQIRCCVDFRNLNKACPKDEFPLPNMDLLIDSAAGHAMFSFMDGFSGYNQIRMSTRDAEKTAFRTPIGNFYYTVMPFGLKNAGATYQRTMTAMFHDMMHKEIEDYVDDIVVKSKKREDHLGILRKVFDRCRLYKLKMNPLKCAFGVSAGKFLGFLVHNRGIDVDPAKASAIATMKAPTSHKELKSFLGRLSYIRRFIPGLAAVTAVFAPLMKKGVPFIWSTACQQAFEKIQQIMTKLPTVCAPVPGRPLRLYLASNSEAIGGLVAQEDEEGTERPIYYVSRALKDAETRYSGAERACLALIYASQRLRHYFLAHKIQLITKSHPIRSLLHRPVLSGRLAQWLLQLSQYEITTETPTAIKSQAIADLLAQFPGEDSSSISHEVPGEIGEALLADLADSTWTLKFDGSSTSSSSGAGIVLAREDGKTIAKSFKLDFPCSNNASEYEAYITGLVIAHEMGIKHLRVIGDSNLIICQTKGEFSLKEPSLALYRALAQKLEEEFDTFEISHAMRCENRYADALATLGSQVSFEGSKVDVTIDKRSMPITDLLREKFKEPNLDAEDWRTPIKAKLVAPEGVADLKVLKDYVLIAGDLYRRLPGGVLARCVNLQEAAKKLTEVHEKCCELRDGISLYRRLQRLGYFWPSMSKEAASLQEQCSFCQHQHESDQIYATFVSSDWRTPFLEYLIENILPQTSQAAVRIKKLATRYFVEGGILFRKGFHGDPLRCLSLAESQTVMKEAHSGECGEHQGKKRLYQLLLTLGYYWPTMKKDTADFVKSCHTCQLQANLIHTHPTSLQNMATPWPFHTWGLDLIGPINPASGGYIWILVATEYFSKWVEAIPLRKATGAAVANFIREHIITRFGIPHKIISDNGTPFVNKNVREVLEHYRIKHRRSTPYYPQGNGQAEATNRMLLRILSKMVFDYGKGWNSHLADTLWAYRGSTKTATGFTPFSLVYGTDAISPTELLVPSPRILHGMDLEADADICAEARVADLEGLEEARELAQARSLRYHQKLADAYEKTLQTRIFAKGQMVLKTVDPCEKRSPLAVQICTKLGGAILNP
uniref:RNA-directed DNA polymerase n=1 Tax=Fagus sylvatica TaxID=28930 RepID=A0A2N9GMR5_FAGSY